MILQILRTRVTPSIIIIYLLFVIMIYYYFVPCGWMCLSLPPVWRQLPTSGSRTASPAGVHSADVRASCNYLYDSEGRNVLGAVVFFFGLSSFSLVFCLVFRHFVWSFVWSFVFFFGLLFGLSSSSSGLFWGSFGILSQPSGRFRCSVLRQVASLDR